MRIKNLCATFAVCGALLACAPNIEEASFQVIPLPQEVTLAEAEGFVINSRTLIESGEGSEAMSRNALFLSDYIHELTGKTLKVSGEASEKSNVIRLRTGLQSPSAEGYRLTVDKDGILIEGASEAGVFYGIQTLRKAIPVVQGADVLVPAATVTDYPRFSYRGAHFDVSRHFFPVESVKRFIDILALHNINRFHWHITDDQGWRIEIKKYPELTTISSNRSETVIGKNTGEYDGTPHGGFFTQDEAREIVRYAAERFITVIPEVDLPGHMQAALAAYPHLGCTGGPYEVWKMWGISDEVLCAGNDETLEFIENVLAEIMDIFPSEYINIGGDECPKVRWEQCPKCQARIKSLGYKDDKEFTAEHYLQSFITLHAERFVNSRGRKIIGWDEILEGHPAKNPTILSWRGIEGSITAARSGCDAIMVPTSYLYFDYYQSQDTENEPFSIGGYVPVEKVYGFEPVSEELTAEEARHIIGLQANLWTEYISDFSHVEYMELPRMAALCEVQWTQPEKKDYADFLQRLPKLVDVYKVKGYNYAKHVLEEESVK